ncbi:MAG: transcriptional regulator [Bacteroidota bacterium]|nr:transcriptional regulator [Bacteroidota bacterium]
MNKKTMTLNLSSDEMTVLDELATQKGVNKTVILKQALRLYQAIQIRMQNGEKVFVEDKKNEKSELILL